VLCGREKRRGKMGPSFFFPAKSCGPFILAHSFDSIFILCTNGANDAHVLGGLDGRRFLVVDDEFSYASLIRIVAAYYPYVF
jgi:hypothetical protein